VQENWMKVFVVFVSRLKFRQAKSNLAAEQHTTCTNNEYHALYLTGYPRSCSLHFHSAGWTSKTVGIADGIANKAISRVANGAAGFAGSAIGDPQPTATLYLPPSLGWYKQQRLDTVQEDVGSNWVVIYRLN
jgi:hypothetical protein